MELIKALSVELEQDLRPLSQALWQRRIPHRVSEQGGQLVIWVLGEAEARQVRALHSQWQQGRLEPVASPPRPRQEGRFRLRPAPLTLLLVVLRSEEHTSELQSRGQLVCRLLLDKKKTI